jgi:hypothetical protein
MIHYGKVKELSPSDRFHLRSELRSEYAVHKSYGYVDCACSERIMNKLEVLKICDHGDLVTTRELKLLIAACG